MEENTPTKNASPENFYTINDSQKTTQKRKTNKLKNRDITLSKIFLDNITSLELYSDPIIQQEVS